MSIYKTFWVAVKSTSPLAFNWVFYFLLWTARTMVQRRYFCAYSKPYSDMSTSGERNRMNSIRFHFRIYKAISVAARNVRTWSNIEKFCSHSKLRYKSTAPIQSSVFMNEIAECGGRKLNCYVASRFWIDAKVAFQDFKAQRSTGRPSLEMLGVKGGRWPISLFASIPRRIPIL